MAKVDLPDRELLDAAPDAMVVVDHAGRIVLVNQQTESLFGYSRAELLDKPIEVLIPERFVAGHPQKRTAFIANAHLRPMGEGLELFGKRQDGSEFPVEISLSPITTDHGQFVASAIRDVTFHKNIEAQLAASKAAAESATAMKSRFLAAASHDLRQPLQSLGLYLSVLRKKVADHPDVVEIGDKMSQSLDVMGELLDALLDISKLDSGAIEADCKSIPLQHLFDQLAADNAPHAGEKGLELIVSPTTAVVYSDPALLLRVLENFMSNAIRYTDHGSVKIECVDEYVSDPAATSVGFVTKPFAGVRIDVVDTGMGIPQEAQETIFGEYFQLDNPARSRNKGLGLGLSIVKHIAQLLGHPLEVSSEPGIGSRFSVCVPLGEQSSTAATPETVVQRSEAVGSPVVLIVDDDPTIVDATKMLLELSDMTVFTALDGEAAIDQIEAGLRPNMLVCDYRLPGKSGVEVIVEIRQHLDHVLPAVLMTGDTSASEIRETDLSAVTVLHKPVDTDQLIEIVQQISTNSS